MKSITKKIIANALVISMLTTCVPFQSVFANTIDIAQNQTDLINASFEQAEGNLPTHWKVLKGGSEGDVQISTEEFSDGAQSIKITDNNNRFYGVDSTPFAVNAGDIYNISTDYKTIAPAENQGVVIYAKFLKADGTEIPDPNGDFSRGEKGTVGTWNKAKLNKIIIPSDATQMFIRIISQYPGVGTVFVDNVVIEKLVSPSDIIPNLSFEEVAGTLPKDWSVMSIGSNGTVDIAKDCVNEGLNSLKITGNDTKFYGVDSSTMFVKEGDTYTVSLDYNPANGQGITLAPKFINAGGEELPYDYRYEWSAIGNANSWNTLTCKFEIPKTAVTMYLRVMTRYGCKGIVYADNIKISANAPQELTEIPNASFENVNEDLSVKDWNKFNPTSVFERTKEEKTNGVYSILLKDERDDAGFGLFSEKILVKPGKTYEFSADFKTESGFGVGIYIRFIDANGNELSSSQIVKIYNSTQTNWNTSKYEIIIPDNAVKSYILFATGKGAKGNIYIDNVVYKEKTEKIPDVLLNTSFEETDSSNNPLYWLKNSVPENISIRSEKVTDGLNSIYLNDTDASSNTNIRSNKISVSAGTEYIAKVDAFAVSGDASIYMEFWDNKGNRIQDSSTGLEGVIGEWKTLEVKGIAPENTAYATILFDLHRVNIGEAYFDNASFGEYDATIQKYPIKETSHPRMFFTSTDIDDLKAKASDTQKSPSGICTSDIFVKIIEDANKYLTETELSISYIGGHTVTYAMPPSQPPHLEEPPTWTGDAYPYWEALSKAVQDRMETLSLAYVITGELKYGNRLKEYTLALSEWDTWLIPTFTHVLAGADTGHFTIAASLGYDVAYDLFTPSERSKVATAIETNGLKKLYADQRKYDHNKILIQHAALARGATVLLGELENADKYLKKQWTILNGI